MFALPEILTTQRVFRAQIRRLEANIMRAATSNHVDFVARRCLMESLFETRGGILRLLYLLKAQKMLRPCGTCGGAERDAKVRNMLTEYGTGIKRMLRKGYCGPSQSIISDSLSPVVTTMTTAEPMMKNVLCNRRWPPHSRFSVNRNVVKMWRENVYSVSVDVRRGRVLWFELLEQWKGYIADRFVKGLSVLLRRCMKSRDYFVELGKVLLGAFLAKRFVDIYEVVRKLEPKLGLTVKEKVKGRTMVMSVGEDDGDFVIDIANEHIELRSTVPLFGDFEGQRMFVERVEFITKRELEWRLSDIRNRVIESKLRKTHAQWLACSPAVDLRLRPAYFDKCPGLGHIDFFANNVFMRSLANVPVRAERLGRILVVSCWTERIGYNGEAVTFGRTGSPNCQLSFIPRDTSAVLLKMGAVSRRVAIESVCVYAGFKRMMSCIGCLARQCIFSEITEVCVIAGHRVKVSQKRDRIVMNFPLIDRVFLRMHENLSWSLCIPQMPLSVGKYSSVTFRSKCVAANFAPCFLELVHKIVVFTRILMEQPKLASYGICVEKQADGEIVVSCRSSATNIKTFMSSPFALRNAELLTGDQFMITAANRGFPVLRTGMPCNGIFGSIMNEFILAAANHGFKPFPFFAGSAGSLCEICHRFSTHNWSIVSGPKLTVFLVFMGRLSINALPDGKGTDSFTFWIPKRRDYAFITIAIENIVSIRKRDLGSLNLIAYEGATAATLIEMQTNCDTISQSVRKLAEYGYRETRIGNDGKEIVIKCEIIDVILVGHATTKGLILEAQGSPDLGELLVSYLDLHRDVDGTHTTCADFVLGLNKYNYADACQILQDRIKIRSRDVYDDRFEL